MARPVPLPSPATTAVSFAPSKPLRVRGAYPSTCAAHFQHKLNDVLPLRRFLPRLATGGRMAYIIAAGIMAILIVGFTRKTILVLALMIGLFFVSVAIYLSMEAQRDRHVRALNDALVLSIRFDRSCSPGKPIRISLHNTSARVLEAVTFDVAGYRAGHSVPLYRTRGYFSDRILPAGERWEECLQMPSAIRGTDVSPLVEHPPETLRWDIENKVGQFR